MNVGTIIIAICYLISGISMTIAAFLTSLPLGFVSISVYLLVVSIVLYKELAEGGSK